MIQGQEKLCQKIDSLTLDNFPSTLLLLGKYGSGKHTMANYIARRFNCELEEISDKLTLEYIDIINQRPTPMVYVIDSRKLTIKNENVILKFLEEPLKNALILVLSENKHSIIPTILNRCQVWELETYDEHFLRSFVTNTTSDVDTLLKVADTPGKIIEYQMSPIKDMIDLSRKIFMNIAKANIANILTLTRHIAFKNEKEKFDFDLFVDIHLRVSYELCLSECDNYFQIYLLTNKLSNDRYIFNVDKKYLFENYLINLKLLMG